MTFVPGRQHEDPAVPEQSGNLLGCRPSRDGDGVVDTEFGDLLCGRVHGTVTRDRQMRAGDRSFVRESRPCLEQDEGALAFTDLARKSTFTGRPSGSWETGVRGRTALGTTTIRARGAISCRRHAHPPECDHRVGSVRVARMTARAGLGHRE